METSTNRLNWHHRKPRFWRRCWIWMAYWPVGKDGDATHLESERMFWSWKNHNFHLRNWVFLSGVKPKKSGLHKFLSQNSSEPNFSNASDPSIKFKLSFCRPWSARILAHLSVARNLTWLCRTAAGCLAAWVGAVGGMKQVGFQEDCYNHKKWYQRIFGKFQEEIF